jgi:peptide-methionine (S)-S-oxide reductase
MEKSMRNLRSTVTVMTAFLVLSGGSLHASGSGNREVATDKRKLAVATFGSGCFWCVEAVYESVEGVQEAVSGYSGGKTKNPTYQEVGSGRTGHAEVVQVYYDPGVVTYAQLVQVYFGSQNPTQVNGQGPDHGSAYRSIIFYRTEAEKEIAQRAKDALAASGKYDAPIAAEIVPYTKFWRGDLFHASIGSRRSFPGC